MAATDSADMEVMIQESETLSQSQEIVMGKETREHVGFPSSH